MATIIRHREIEDCFAGLTLDEITAHPHGTIPEYKANRLLTADS